MKNYYLQIAIYLCTITNNIFFSQDLKVQPECTSQDRLGYIVVTTDLQTSVT